jgi:hypothetical protein
VHRADSARASMVSLPTARSQGRRQTKRAGSCVSAKRGSPDENMQKVNIVGNCPGWATAGFGEKILWTGEAGSDSSIG